MNHISMKKSRPRCYAKSSIAQDAFQPGLISSAGVTRRSELLSYAQNAAKWLALSERSVKSTPFHTTVLHTAVLCPKVVCSEDVYPILTMLQRQQYI